MRRVSEIIIHCTATPRGRNVTVEQIRECHVKQNGWNDIGYHHVVYLDGTVHKGRPEEIAGAHCLGHNNQSIGVVYVGGIEANGQPSDTRTPEQKRSLRTLVGELLKRYPGATVHGHNEFAAKACPSFDVTAEFGKKIVGMIVTIIFSMSMTGCGTFKKTAETKSRESETIVESTIEKQSVTGRLLEFADLSVLIDSVVIERPLIEDTPTKRLKTGRVTLKLTQKRIADASSDTETEKEYRKTAETESETETGSEIETHGGSIIYRVIILLAVIASGWIFWRFCRQKW